MPWAAPWRCAIVPFFALAAACVVVLFCGCYSVDQITVPQSWTVLCANEIPALGDSVIFSPLCRSADNPILLKVGSILDKTRFTVDSDLLMKKMRTYLVNRSGGKILVFDNDAEIASFCETRREKLMNKSLKSNLRYLAERIAKTSAFREKTLKLRIAPVEVIGADVNINPDGLVSLLRDELVLAGDGRFLFVSEKSGGADCLIKCCITGLEVSQSPSGRAVPLDADFNLRVVFENQAGDSCFETSLPMRRRIFDPSLDATYVLSGELNVLTRETPGFTDDYVRMGFNITDPNTTLHVWEGACEISTTTFKSILYQ